MARPRRIAFGGALYHVTARVERKPVYRDAYDRRRFLSRGVAGAGGDGSGVGQ